MIDLLVEGVDSLRLPCSWVLAIPAVAATIFGARRMAPTVATLVLAASTIAWLRFAGWWFAVPGPATQVAIGATLLAAVAAAWRLDRTATDIGVSALVGAAAAWSWIPCVGPHLGDVLNNAHDAPLDHAAGTLAFMTGQHLPFIIIAATTVAVPRIATPLDHPNLRRAGTIAVVAIGLAFATTLFDDLASELARRSDPGVLG